MSHKLIQWPFWWIQFSLSSLSEETNRLIRIICSWVELYRSPACLLFRPTAHKQYRRWNTQQETSVIGAALHLCQLCHQQTGWKWFSYFWHFMNMVFLHDPQVAHDPEFKKWWSEIPGGCSIMVRTSTSRS